MLKSFLNRISSALITSRRGATAIEYGILAALVALVIVAGASAVGTNLNTSLTEVSNLVS